MPENQGKTPASPPTSCPEPAGMSLRDDQLQEFRPHTADSDLQCRRADSKEQHPNQKADKAAVENYVRHRLN